MARVHVDLQQRWSDMDSYQHVNNVAYARYFEEARIRWLFVGETREDTGLERLFRDDSPNGMKMVVASQTIDFVQPIEYSPKPLVAELWIGHLGGASIDIYGELIAETHERPVFARCLTTAVVVDGTTMRPKRLSAAAREAAERWMDAPINIGRQGPRAAPNGY